MFSSSSYVKTYPTTHVLVKEDKLFRWIFYLQGGGWCWNSTSCADRIDRNGNVRSSLSSYTLYTAVGQLVVQPVVVSNKRSFKARKLICSFGWAFFATALDSVCCRAVHESFFDHCLLLGITVAKDTQLPVFAAKILWG